MLQCRESLLLQPRKLTFVEDFDCDNLGCIHTLKLASCSLMTLPDSIGELGAIFGISHKHKHMARIKRYRSVQINQYGTVQCETAFELIL